MRLLMEQRAILDQEDANGITALMRALNQNHRDIVKQLIAGGADVTKKPESGITPLVIAIRNGDAEIVRLVLEKGASPSEKVNILVKDDEFSDLRQLIGLGKRIGVVEVSPLASALLCGHTEIVGLLLDAGADKNEKLPNGNRLLKDATLMGNTELMNLLMERGATT